jgi:hypothetical protein
MAHSALPLTRLNKSVNVAPLRKDRKPNSAVADSLKITTIQGKKY